MRSFALIAALLASACSSLPVGPQGDAVFREEPWNGHRVQGLIGLTEVTSSPMQLDSDTAEILDSGVSTLPMIGGVWQRPLPGEGVRLGLEGGFTAGWDGDTGVVALNNGALLVVQDNDLLALDLFVGPYLEIPMGQRWRSYVGAGPLLQFARVDLEYVDDSNNFVSEGESDWGGGMYARAGIEVDLGRGTHFGFGVRWFESNIDLGGPFDELDLEAVQYFITATTSF